MNLKQIILYRKTWSFVEKMLKGQGAETDEVEAARMDVHEQVTSSRCSSKSLTNRQLDQVLTAFNRLSDNVALSPSKLANQPAKRCRFVIEKLRLQMGKSKEYVEGISQKMNHVSLEYCDENQLKKVISGMNYQLKRETKKEVNL
jgi:hypothetical protein